MDDQVRLTSFSFSVLISFFPLEVTELFLVVSFLFFRPPRRLRRRKVWISRKCPCTLGVLCESGLPGLRSQINKNLVFIRHSFEFVRDHVMHALFFQVLSTAAKPSPSSDFR